MKRKMLIVHNFELRVETNHKLNFNFYIFYKTIWKIHKDTFI